MRYLALVIVLALSGCRTVWVHPEWNEHKFNDERAECMYATQWQVCMLTHGWKTEAGFRWEDQSRTPRGGIRTWWFFLPS